MKWEAFVDVRKSHLPGTVSIFASSSEFEADFENFYTIDLLILDIQLPDVNGTIFAKSFREEFPSSTLIFCSGKQSPTPESFESEPYRYLLKAWSDEHMVKKLASIVAHMSIDVLPDITFAELPSADIISILSNLLDNAVEACRMRDNSRVVQLTITKKNDNNFYVIIVRNTFDKAPVLRDGQFVSTKTDTKLHGIGTKSIRHAVENNHGFVNYSIEGGFFVATVVLPVSLNV